MDLSRLNWIDRQRHSLRIGQLVQVPDIADIARHASQLRRLCRNLARLVMDVYGDELRQPAPRWAGAQGNVPTRVRVPRGELPEPC